MRKQIDPHVWKKRFFSLLFLNGLVLLIITSCIFLPTSKTNIIKEDIQPTADSSEFVIRTTKKNLNDLVNAYLIQLLQQSKHHYQLSLNDDVELIGELPIFSTTVPLFIKFEPFVQENGDLVLKQKSISVGLLQLPNKKVMQYVSAYLPMPDWVIVNPQDEEIYVKVTDMDIKSNFHVKIERFDLEANDIAFKINVPYKSLGIEKQ